MYSIEKIRENYRNFSDEKIKKIALVESKGLRKEVLPILKEEIKRRNLDESMLVWIDAENHTLTELEKRSLIRRIENLKCPSCGLKTTPLRGQKFTTIYSILIWCYINSEELILCIKCGRSKKAKSFLINGLAGWWSKRGFLLTPYTLIKDFINLFYKQKINDKIIADFIERNTGTLRLNGMDEESLYCYIENHNKSQSDH